MPEPPALADVSVSDLTLEEASARLCRLPPPAIDEPLERLRRERILVTGAAGSIGTAAQRALAWTGVQPLVTDLPGLDGSRPLDVRDAPAIEEALASFRPTLVLHLAGAKSAPAAETEVHSALEVNAWGTATLVAAAGRAGARVVTASTCKACDPETVYGATKLLAERLTIAAGGSVARFYNVVESSGNVFETWRSLPPDEPLPVTPCSRYLISLADATSLLLWTAVLPPGRYTIDPGDAWTIADVASQLYPSRPQREIAPRRGDRLVEPRCAGSETVERYLGRIERIVNRHDATSA